MRETRPYSIYLCILNHYRNDYLDQREKENVGCIWMFFLPIFFER